MIIFCVFVFCMFLGLVFGMSYWERHNYGQCGGCVYSWINDYGCFCHNKLRNSINTEDISYKNHKCYFFEPQNLFQKITKCFEIFPSK